MDNSQCQRRLDCDTIPREFWRGPVLEKARAALGMVLVRHDAGVTRRGRIVEVEAYGGSDDPASHAYRRKTPRNAVMFEPGGVAYVYFVYGMHFCLNFVAGIAGEASAILVRALEPVEDIHGRTDGPARLCAALKIDRRHNGLPLESDALWLERGDSPIPQSRIACGPRIGINPDTPAAGRPWRFVIKDTKHASRPIAS